MSFIRFSAAILHIFTYDSVMGTTEQPSKETSNQRISQEGKQTPSNRNGQIKAKALAPTANKRAHPILKDKAHLENANASSPNTREKMQSTPKTASHPQPVTKRNRSGPPPPPPPASNILMTQQGIAKAVAATDKGQGKIIPFFGFYDKHSIHTNMAPSSGNGFWYLSNYYESQPSYPVAVQINYKGTVYTFKATENAYQAGKCLISGVVTQDVDIQKFVSATPNDAKDLANNQFDCGKISGTQMLALMNNLVGQKFAGPLGAKLRSETGLTTLMEGNNWGDTYWGCPFDGTKYTQNCDSHLGETLENVRANGINPGAFEIK